MIHAIPCAAPAARPSSRASSPQRSCEQPWVCTNTYASQRPRSGANPSAGHHNDPCSLCTTTATVAPTARLGRPKRRRKITGFGPSAALSGCDAILVRAERALGILDRGGFSPPRRGAHVRAGLPRALCSEARGPTLTRGVPERVTELGASVLSQRFGIVTAPSGRAGVGAASCPCVRACAAKPRRSPHAQPAHSRSANLCDRTRVLCSGSRVVFGVPAAWSGGGAVSPRIGAAWARRRVAPRPLLRGAPDHFTCRFTMPARLGRGVRRSLRVRASWCCRRGGRSRR